MSDYRISVVSPEEAKEVLERLRARPVDRVYRKVVLEGGFEMKGSFEITARDAASGEVAWTHADENLITDYGRRQWVFNRFSVAFVGFQASTETPSPSRSSLSGDSTQFFESTSLTPTNNSTTYTKTFTFNLATPANNRTLGTISLSGVVADTKGFRNTIMAYALLTPPKTQTTTQTLEVVYKISMSPIS